MDTLIALCALWIGWMLKRFIPTGVPLPGRDLNPPRERPRYDQKDEWQKNFFGR